MSSTLLRESEDPHIGLEDRLVRHLQPLRGFVLTSALYHLFELGIADVVLAAPSSTISDISARLALDPKRLEAVLLFLQVEGFVQVDGDAISHTAKLIEFKEAWPWYEMLIGGYGQTYLDIGKGLRAKSGALPRDGASVGSGSCKISHYDAIPLTRELLQKLNRPPTKVIDLGCGNAQYLRELCGVMPGLTAIGVEPDQRGYDRTAERLRHSDLEPRIRLYHATAQQFIESSQEEDVDVLIIAFVLQEILGQDGRAGLIQFLQRVGRKFPESKLIVIEVDNQLGNGPAMDHPLAQCYYNPYYLIHPFTSQALETERFWLSAFEEAGLKVSARSTTNPNVDSTGLEIGFLLEKA